MVGTAKESQRQRAGTSRKSDEILWPGRNKNRKQRKCNVLAISKAPEIEKRGVGQTGLELVHMTEANIKEGKPLKRGPCRKDFREKHTKLKVLGRHGTLRDER